MVMTYNAYMIIGLSIVEEDLQIKTIHQHQLCHSQVNLLHFNYCPTCGIKNKTGSYTNNHYINEYDPDYSENLSEDKRIEENYLTYGMLTLNNNQYKVITFEYSPVLYISIYESICYDNDSTVKSCQFSLEELCVLKDQLFKDLSLIGFKNFKDFKIYTLLNKD